MYAHIHSVVVVILMYKFFLSVVLHICDGGLDLYIIFISTHIVHIVREVKV